MTIDVSLIPQNRVENLLSKLSEIENNIGNIGTDITNNVVHKTGNETIIGTKTFTDTIFSKGNITLGTSTNTWGKMVQFQDTTGKRIARIQPWAIDTTNNRVGMWVNNADNTVEKGISIDSDGTTYAPHPTTAQDSSNKIATTAWVNNLDNSVVHKAGNETINGTKTFNNEIIFNDIPVFNGGKNDSTEGGEIHIASTPNKGWDKDTTTIDEQDGGIRFFNFKNNQVYGYRFDLNDGKGLPKARMVVDAYKSGTSWYRIWSDGWIEQGGRVSISQDTQTTVTLLKPFLNTDYMVLISASKSGLQTGGDGNFTVEYISSSQFKWGNGDDFSGTGIWYACGY